MAEYIHIDRVANLMEASFKEGIAKGRGIDSHASGLWIVSHARDVVEQLKGSPSEYEK